MSSEGGRPTLLYYLHIQKNGGNSARAWFADTFGDDCTLELMVPGRALVTGRARTWYDAQGAVRDVRAFATGRQFGVVVGNLPYGMHVHVDAEVVYATVLREPVARCVSFWKHAYRLRDRGNAWNLIEQCDLRPSRAVARGLLQLSNDQTRLVGGSAEARLGPRDLRRAKDLIASRYLVVGMQGDLAEALARVAAHYGVTPAPVDTLNAAPQEEEQVPLPPEALAEFAELNQHDQRLVEWFVAETGGRPW